MTDATPGRPVCRRQGVRHKGMIRNVFLITADFIGLGHSHSSFGVTLALAITFLGIGVLVNFLIGYAVFAVLAERRQNQERMAAYDRGERPTA